MCLHPEALAVLAAFRQEVYAGLGHRQDSLFELLDAVLTAPDRSPLVRLSLGPAFRRRWPRLLPGTSHPAKVGSRSVDMAEELAAVIDELRAAKPVPFSTSAMVNRKDLIERLEEVRDNIPLEIKRAAGVVADRQEIGRASCRERVSYHV